jgi:CubicO group peptidase (beta-lactamase class C family)
MRPLKSANPDRLLEEGLSDRVYPGAVLLVAHRGKRVLFRAVGHAALEPHRIPMQKGTIFDLASLTKPLATTLAMMTLVEQGGVNLEDTLGGLLPGRVPEDKRAITPRKLLSHASGMADWQPFYSGLDAVPPDQRKRQVRDWIMDIPLVSSPGSESLYSDLGFMVLEWIIELKTGKNLNEFLLDQWYGPLGLKNLFLYEQARSPYLEKTAFAATEFCARRNRVLQGEVQDENAYAVGGYAGHAGLFGTAEDVSGIAGFLLQCYLGIRKDLLQPATVRAFFTRQGEPEDTTWALGWDTPSPSGSSAGDCFSEKSVGHLGFTGTSLWMDLEKQVSVIFLTNRVHPSRENEKIKAFRPRIHNGVMEMLGFGKRRGGTNG